MAALQLNGTSVIICYIRSYCVCNSICVCVSLILNIWKIIIIINYYRPQLMYLYGSICYPTFHSFLSSCLVYFTVYTLMITSLTQIKKLNTDI